MKLTVASGTLVEYLRSWRTQIQLSCWLSNQFNAVGLPTVSFQAAARVGWESGLDFEAQMSQVVSGW